MSNDRSVLRCKQEDSECTEARKEGRKIRGLLVCEECSKLLNRDYNAARNIARAARADLNDNERPSCLCRKGGENKSIRRVGSFISYDVSAKL